MSGEPTTLTLTATLVYDAENMHSGDKDADARQWFMEEVLGGERLVLLDQGEIGDVIGQLVGVRVVARDEASEPKGSAWDQVTDEHVLGAFLDAQAEALRYREALEAVLNSCHRGIYDAGWVLEAVAQAEALVAPGLGEDYRKAQARAALEHRLAGKEGHQ